jgi:predicted transcriptional regulator
LTSGPVPDILEKRFSPPSGPFTGDADVPDREIPPPPQTRLSRLERGILDALYRLGEGTVADVTRAMPGEPSHDSVRVTLRILERKGVVTHRQEGPRYVYRPAVPAERARRQAAGHLTRTFFGGKPSRAILALLDMSAEQIPREELDEIAARIERAARETSEGPAG